MKKTPFVMTPLFEIFRSRGKLQPEWGEVVIREGAGGRKEGAGVERVGEKGRAKY